MVALLSQKPLQIETLIKKVFQFWIMNVWGLLIDLGIKLFSLHAELCNCVVVLIQTCLKYEMEL